MVQHAQFKLSLLKPKYWGIWLGVAVTSLLSLLPIKTQMKIGAGIGRLALRYIPRRSKVAKRNLELCFPEMSEQQREKLLKQNFEQTGKAIFDTVNAWSWSNKRIQKHMKIEGQQHVEQAINDGHGVLLFAVHCLPLEMGARIFGQFHPGVGVYRPHDNPVMEYLQVRGRLRSNKALVSKRDVRDMIKALRQKNVVWYTADQDFGRSTAVFIPLFAVEQAATITAATSLAKLGKAKVLPFFVERNDDDSGYRINIAAPLENFPGTDEIEDATRGNKVIEQLIMQNPSQYMWLHRRFKTRPNPQDAPLY
ncbi:LpxL/LpxP family Kdo(2)-lipid IV(A) lauroyl/palmitoleoyl acyltransferase [Paraferrimonas sp. SM1919]|uniref:LpxL/LpxP family Kdo(2)-lipid IV(A) lauroyl/palmitoleoyl acyltransferase n=1 Tax=Paraferrimonas sp. SM1919 TaxID=2662263 RepID=UPI0013D444F2|nr:LpxL/LpxP family Kdo(2)-lipid IV(A) lauroyl/palmitoleoyl acyltransferase [Paraferrimonas sp. SM1919]